MAKKYVQIILLMIAMFLMFISVINNFNKSNMTKNNYFSLTSPAFENDQQIPRQYTCNGANINPPLLISNVPQGTKSLVLIVDDPDAPAGDWVHWLVWNIPAETPGIDEGSLPTSTVQGLNDFKNNKYDGPCPPSGTHRYYFKLYALDYKINLDKSSRKSAVENAIEGHILDLTSLIGLYSK